MAFIQEPLFIKSSVVTEVPAGQTAVLNCNSNDYNHNFLFWLYDGVKVIGPGSDNDETKYKYNVLSGTLQIDRVDPAESGYYSCVSRKLDDSSVTMGVVQMIVSGSSFSAIDAVKLVAIVVSIIVLLSCALIYRKLKRDQKKFDERGVLPVDEEEDENGDEIYNKTTRSLHENQPVPGPSRNTSSDHLIYGIDNQGLDTDFNSVFENIQIKSPSASLI